MSNSSIFSFNKIITNYLFVQANSHVQAFRGYLRIISAIDYLFVYAVL